jgi:hypothetical protein
VGSLKVWDGAAWQTASQQGPAGPPTAPAGGNTDDLLVKSSSTNYDTRWTPYLNSVTIGAVSATTGSVRLPASGSIYARDASNVMNIPLITHNGVTNEVMIGGTNDGGVMIGNSTTSKFGIGGFTSARSSGWSVTAGYSALKTLDPNTTTLAALARVVGTLVDVLKGHGVILP